MTIRNWEYQGKEYTGRELLQTYGGTAGIEAVHRSQHWAESPYNLDYSPGFVVSLFKLALQLGAVYTGIEKPLWTKEYMQEYLS